MTPNDSPLARAAHGYVEDGLAVIPLKPGGKEPATKHGTKDWSDNPEQIDYWWGVNAWHNVGIVCGTVSGGLVAIDLDVHDPEHDGREFLREWEVEHGKLPETWAQVTGSGGMQLLYRTGRDIRNSANGAIGVDIRGEGGFVVAPPSIHPNGERYEWRVSPEDCGIADADDNVHDFIAAVQPGGARAGGRKPTFELPAAIDVNRNNTLFKYACSLREKGLDTGSIRILLDNANAERCKPPLPDWEVEKVAGSVERYEPGNAEKGEGEENPLPMMSVRDVPDKPARALKSDEETVDRIVNMLMSFKEIRCGIMMNEFDGRLHVVGDCIDGVRFERDHVMTDGESMKLLTFFERRAGVRRKPRFLDALAAYGATEGQSYNPMRARCSLLPIVRGADGRRVSDDDCQEVEVSCDNGATWVRHARMCGTLLEKYLGCELSEYNYEAERLAMRQIVARALYPGCKADVMPVLVGAQGIGKSTFVAALALDQQFFLEGFSNFNDEDLKRLAGKLVVEIPELDGFGGRDMNRIKSVLTRQYDTYRESYARNPVDHPRTSVFFGTTNDSAFLTDTTGNRRFMPIECKRPACSPYPGLFTDELRRDVEQAWGEVLAEAEELGREAFLRTLQLPKSVARQAIEMQEAYTQEDYTLSTVQEYLQSLPPSAERVCVKKVMVEGMDYDEYRFAKENGFVKATVANAIGKCEGWKRNPRKQRCGKYGIVKVWERC